MRDPVTIAEAVKETGRGRRTIERWIAEGLLDVAVTRNTQGRVIRRAVSHAELFKILREKNRSNPSVAAITDDDTPPC